MPESGLVTRVEHELGITVVRDLHTLRDHHAAWRDLAAQALESNVFYEPEALLPALAHLPASRPWRVLLIRDRERLIGLVPLRERGLGGIGQGVALELLQYPHSYLHTPLIHQDAAAEAVETLTAWCARIAGPALLLATRLTLDGPVCHLLRERAQAHGLIWHDHRRFERPTLVPAGEAEDYLRRVLKSDRWRELGRQRRKLEATGEVRFASLEPGEDPAPWIQGFLELEASGWKGANGSALASKDGHARFFATMVEELHARDRVLFHGLRLDGRWIAMSCNLAGAAGGAFAFKVAFDEELRRMAPGLLLEAQSLREIFARHREIGWMDSCCGRDNTVIARMWGERRPIGDLVLAAPGLKGRVAFWAWRRGKDWSLQRAAHDRRPLVKDA
jgi:CelD/BcsL family acetyltransferase involved in cellulose biosynthesis